MRDLPHRRALVGRLRVTLRRSRAPRLAAVIIVGLLAGRAVDGAVARADAARAAWGPTRHVWVATEEVRPGDVLGPSNVGEAAVPARLVPSDAETTDPRGRRARDAIAPREVIRSGRLDPDGRGEVAARLPPTQVGLTIDTGTTPLTTTDRVHLHDALSGRRLTAAPARVVDVGDQWTTVALPPTEVEAAVRAVSAGGVTAVLAG